MSMQSPVVGLVLNYRDAQSTTRSVESILDQGAEHVVVWDNSGDDGISAQELLQNISSDRRISVEISPNNLGFSAGINHGACWIREHFGQAWILILNNDAYLLPGAITALRHALAENQEAIIAYPDINHAGKILGTVYYHRFTGILSWRKIPGSFAYASGCCQLIAPERTGGPIFDEDFFMYGEDWFQGWLLGKTGMVHVDQTLVYHEGSRSSGMGSIFYETRLNVAHWILARKLSRNRLDWSFLYSGHLSLLLLRAAARGLRFRSLVPVRAFARGWRFARMGNHEDATSSGNH